MGKFRNLSEIVETGPGGGFTPFPPLHVNLPSKFWHFTMKILAFYIWGLPVLRLADQKCPVEVAWFK